MKVPWREKRREVIEVDGEEGDEEILTGVREVMEGMSARIVEMMGILEE